MELGRVRLLKRELDRCGIVSKIRVSRKGIKSGGNSFSRGALYELLSNPVYIGEIQHKKQRHPGQHQPILDRAEWEKVQKQLNDYTARKGVVRSRAGPSWLAGKLFDESGEPLYVQGALKAGRRYRYYVSRALVRNPAIEVPRGWRVPAAEIERAIFTATRS